VDLANDAGERQKLNDKYVAVLDECNRKGIKSIADDFELACKSSQAVFALNAHKLYREIASGTDVFETYYDLERLKNRIEDGTGLSEPMISHRVTCFEGNTAVLYHQNRTFADLTRSDWQNRHEICVAMFAEQLTLGSTQADFPAILVQSGKTSLEDQFVEVHLFGPMTVRTFEAVRFERKKHSSREAVFVQAAIDKLNANNVKVILA
jgi:hypothetical protein